MNCITIDCAAVSSREEFHRILAERLAFPAHYGHNLDALHDCLTAITADTHLILENWGALPPAFRGFQVVMNDTEDENPHWIVTFR